MPHSRVSHHQVSTVHDTATKTTESEEVSVERNVGDTGTLAKGPLPQQDSAVPQPLVSQEMQVIGDIGDMDNRGDDKEETVSPSLTRARRE